MKNVAVVTTATIVSRMRALNLRVDSEPRFGRRTGRWKLVFFNARGHRSWAVAFANELQALTVLDELHDALAVGGRNFFRQCRL